VVVNRKEHARHSKRVTSTQRWQVLRHAILERDGWKCRCCGDRRRLEIDHIKSVRTAPELAFDPKNLQALCGPCHTRKTRLECGHKEKTPERKAWASAVADLAAETVTPEDEAENA
jgi:5-methylcytosine-specific restriction enzyme A